MSTKYIPEVTKTSLSSIRTLQNILCRVSATEETEDFDTSISPVNFDCTDHRACSDCGLNDKTTTEEEAKEAVLTMLNNIKDMSGD